MFLTLTVRSLRHRLVGTGGGAVMTIEQAPKYVLEVLGLRGLIVDTEFLRGRSIDDMDALRHQADQVGCPCLILRESMPVPVEEAGRGKGSGNGINWVERLDLLARAAHRLGCNAFAITPAAAGETMDVGAAAKFLQGALERMDRLEVNMLLEQGGGVTGRAETLIDLVKKVGGFRIGTMPSFGSAMMSEDSVASLRQTAPYAGAVLATCGTEPAAKVKSERATKAAAARARKSKGKGKRGATKGRKAVKGAEEKVEAAESTAAAATVVVPAAPMMSLSERGKFQKCVDALVSVGYQQIVALDFVGAGDSTGFIEASRAMVLASIKES